MEPLNITAEQPDHLSLATHFANEIISRFSAIEQNEVVNLIRKHLVDSRNESIESAEKHIAYLKDSICNL